MNSFLDSTWAVRCVWMRYFDVFRKSMVYGIVTTLIEPALYLFSFGYGMASLIGTLKVHGMEVNYRQFIFSGIVSQTILFQGFFEAAYGAFIRMYYQKIFKAMATTPITLSEVLWGELFWDATKGMFAASAVLAMGVAIGDFNPIGALVALPLTYLSALLFSGMGLWVAGTARTIESISYPQYLIVFPMFLFCGVFYPIETLPGPLQIVAWILPLTSVNSLIRSLTLGFPIEPQAFPILLTWLVILVFGSRRAMTKRLVR